MPKMYSPVVASVRLEGRRGRTTSPMEGPKDVPAAVVVWPVGPARDEWERCERRSGWVDGGRAAVGVRSTTVQSSHRADSGRERARPWVGLAVGPGGRLDFVNGPVEWR